MVCLPPSQERCCISWVGLVLGLCCSAVHLERSESLPACPSRPQCRCGGPQAQGPLEMHPSLTTAEELRGGMVLEVCCDDVCYLCAEALIVEEVQRHAPGCSAKVCAAWSCEAEGDTLVISWVSCCLVKTVRGCADPASQLL